MDCIGCFPDWEITEELGEGAFSKVYKIRKSDGLGGAYYSALKVIPIPCSKDEYKMYKEDGYDDISISKIFEQQARTVTGEFKTLACFRGTTNIVSLEDHKVVQNPDGIGWTVYIRMELLDTLTNIHGKTPLTVADTVKVGVDICNALILCEKKKIIHRDIKPQNIFVNDFGDYKLGDFGISRTMEGATRGTKIGTPAYMAPQVYHGGTYYSNVDIYSLGMVLYWLLNERRLPFVPLPPVIPTAEQVNQAQTMRLNGAEILPPKDGNSALKAAVIKACQYDPQKRFATAKEFKAALENSMVNGTAASAVHSAPNSSFWKTPEF